MPAHVYFPGKMGTMFYFSEQLRGWFYIPRKEKRSILFSKEIKRPFD
jgi:hypothetical protein